MVERSAILVGDGDDDDDDSDRLCSAHLFSCPCSSAYSLLCLSFARVESAVVPAFAGKLSEEVKKMVDDGDDAACSTIYYGRRIYSKAAEEGSCRAADAPDTKKKNSDRNHKAGESAHRPAESPYYGRKIYSKANSNDEAEQEVLLVVVEEEEEGDNDGMTQVLSPFYGRMIFSKIEETCQDAQAPPEASKYFPRGNKQSGSLRTGNRSSK